MVLQRVWSTIFFVRKSVVEESLRQFFSIKMLLCGGIVVKCGKNVDFDCEIYLMIF